MKTVEKPRGRLAPQRTAELVPLVYLDLNHWVNLTRARLGRSGTAAHRELLDELAPAVAAGRVTVPLSGTHYIELSRIRDPMQRAEVALTMAACLATPL